MIYVNAGQRECIQKRLKNGRWPLLLMQDNRNSPASYGRAILFIYVLLRNASMRLKFYH
jgi:hypothetical protein